jgi:hypothetical protein
MQENMAKKARAIEQKLTLMAEAALNEGHREDANGDNGPMDPLTARAIRPSMHPPAQASFPLGLPPLAENWTDKTNAFMQQQKHLMMPPDISITASSAAATPVPPLEGLREDDDDDAASNSSSTKSAHSRGPANAKKTPEAAAAAKPDVDETSQNEAKTAPSVPTEASSPPAGDGSSSAHVEAVK